MGRAGDLVLVGPPITAKHIGVVRGGGEVGGGGEGRGELVYMVMFLLQPPAPAPAPTDGPSSDGEEDEGGQEGDEG